MSEYDPVFGGSPTDGAADDLERVRERFEAASRPYLSVPWGWLAWAAVLPGAALATPQLARAGGPPAVLLLWSLAILAGGTVEIVSYRRAARAGTTPLASWALRVQGNLSLATVALSAALLLGGQARLLPGLWLLLLGHSLYLLGGLAFVPLRRCGLLYQAAGLLALALPARGLWIFAAAAALGNAGVALAILRRR